MKAHSLQMILQVFVFVCNTFVWGFLISFTVLISFVGGYWIGILMEREIKKNEDENN